MASIPSGSLLAKKDFYRRRLSSCSSVASSSSGADRPWDCADVAPTQPHPPALPTSESGHWWINSFLGKAGRSQSDNLPPCQAMQKLSEALAAQQGHPAPV
ncbi:pancreatic progenitor cell differentiation and proliferation factor [Petromyzon marinus]|uniref:Pancreatic progenitor cell differentiation and proliferation factor n=1 Tax=Petromyzon marinus TaxID=7757 RepID=A0AAJ7T267_PETMA|nr:pancreatic progenitor cell differentiation and proliferation factor [Petromyzon marinus]XP_032808966.1 pancreatic progenitor cell differentiation and proliferation factor [Petromyzon marinus]